MDHPNFRLTAEIVKSDDEEQFVLGVVLVPDEIDSQDDTVPASEIRRAAHRFMEFYRDVKLQHERSTTIQVVESFLAPQDLQIGNRIVRSGAWLMGVHVNDDDVWAQVKAGKLRGFSIGGYAKRVPLEANA